ncbi:MAG TPA: hypothetical protein VFV40_04870 [Nocardioides sp.]|nr:hypothetical protein [Nocardioides sp.]
MNDTTRLEVRPDVAEFLDKVRARLADLTDEEREELLGGLEADLMELVADGGSVAELGDPRAYADELRTAAGLERRARSGRGTGVRRPHRPVRVVVADGLDAVRARWERVVSGRPGLAASWAVVTQLRPVWWVLRAWVFVQLLDTQVGPWEWPTLLPRFGDDVSGLLILAAAVAGSVLMGLGRIWPASHVTRSVAARVVLVLLNAFAVLQLFLVVDSFPNASYLHEQAHPCSVGLCGPQVSRAGLVSDGKIVRNVFAYDAEGNPLEGVQLFDQNGRPLDVEQELAYRMRYAGRLPTIYPWSQGERKVWNVYPLPVAYDGGGWQRTDRVWTRDEPPFLPQPPLVAVPPAFLPLPQEAEPAADASQPAAAEQPADPEPAPAEPEGGRP